MQKRPWNERPPAEHDQSRHLNDHTDRRQEKRRRHTGRRQEKRRRHTGRRQEQKRRHTGRRQENRRRLEEMGEYQTTPLSPNSYLDSLLQAASCSLTEVSPNMDLLASLGGRFEPATGPMYVGNEMKEFAKFQLWSANDEYPPEQFDLLLYLMVCRQISYQIENVTNRQFGFLWELYWDEPELLGQITSKLVIPLAGTDRIRASPANAAELQLIFDFLFPGGFCCWVSLASDKAYLGQINRDRLEKLKLDDNRLKHWVEETYKDGYRFNQFPKWQQLSIQIDERFYQHLAVIGKQIKTLLEDEIQSPVEPLSSCSNELDIFKKVENIWESKSKISSILLFAVSGSGKTRSIKHLLSRKWGFYFQACNVAEASAEIHSPYRSKGSRDTLTLGRFIRRSPNRFPNHFGSENPLINPIKWIQQWLTNLIYCRVLVLKAFMGVVDSELPHLCNSNSLYSLPRLWLFLQTNSKVDLFDNLFQLSCAKTSTTHIEMSHFSRLFRDEPFFYCLDEAQADLDFTINVDSHQVSLLECWSKSFTHHSPLPGLDVNYEPLELIVEPDDVNFKPKLGLHRKSPNPAPCIFAGTSLKAQEAEGSINKHGFTYGIPSGRNSGKVELLSDFPLTETEHQFGLVMEKHGTAGIVGTADQGIRSNLIDMISKYGKPLRGRTGWTVRYLKHVNGWLLSHNAHNLLPDFSLEPGIQKLAEEVINEVKNDLIARLQRIATEDLMELMSDICWTVIQCDLFSRPVAFSNIYGPKMISEAFAIMREYPGQGQGSQYWLVERLAVDAAKEYFVNQKPDLVEIKLLEFLRMASNDSSLFGKASEWFLAWRLNRIFNVSGVKLCGSEGDHLPELLNLLSEATPLNGGQKLNLSQYDIIQGSNTGLMYRIQGVELSEWMGQIRNTRKDTGRKVDATFYFPENQAGPDLVFALKSNSSRNLVLCLLQLKCGKDAELDKAIRSTDLEKAYLCTKNNTVLNGYGDKRQRLMDELQEWEKESLPILRVVATVAVDARKPMHVRVSTRSPEYFLRCDKKSVNAIFGPRFEVLIQRVKEGYDNLLGLYRLDIE